MRQHNAAIVAKLKRFEEETAAYHVLVQGRWAVALVRYCLRHAAHVRTAETEREKAVAAHNQAVRRPVPSRGGAGF